jgi:hypothetical protein
MFFGAEKASINEPRFTSDPPQLHHKNTTIETHIFAKPPAKIGFHRAKNFLLLCLKSDSTPCQKQRESAS